MPGLGARHRPPHRAHGALRIVPKVRDDWQLPQQPGPHRRPSGTAGGGCATMPAQHLRPSHARLRHRPSRQWRYAAGSWCGRLPLRFCPDSRTAGIVPGRCRASQTTHADLRLRRCPVMHAPIRQTIRRAIPQFSSRSRSLRDHCNGRKRCTACADASIHRSSNSHGMHRASVRHGCGACHGVKAKFCVLGRPFRHLFLII